MKNFPGARKGKRRGSKGNVRRAATARGATEKGGCVRVIEGEDVRRYGPANTSSPRWSKVTLESQRELWQLKSPRMKRFLVEGRMEGEKESVLLSVGEERIRGAYTLRNDTEEELLREMLIPT